jgi:hypothetical protein
VIGRRLRVSGVRWDTGYHRKGSKLPPIRRVGEAKLGDRVFEMGNGSGLTYGRVKLSMVATQFVTDEGTGWFKNLIGVIGKGRFSRAGDSGAMVITMSGDVLGHIGGASASMTFICPAVVTFAALGCRLLTATRPD